MPRTDVIVIGAGQAGLAMSSELAAYGIDHVVLERGQVAERWRSNTWDSLRLLTPNWMTRLPSWRYRGPDPDGYMNRTEIIHFLSGYAGAIAAPVIGHSPVLKVAPSGQGFSVKTPDADWQARAVVIATGHCEVPSIPTLAGSLAAGVHQMHSSAYRIPTQLPQGNVLVVGASPSGVQIAQELALSGRGVTLSVGRHTPMPRMFMGRDIFWWMDRTGILDEEASDIPDIEAARAQPGLQLVGRPDRIDLNLMLLERRGVRLTGRLARADGRQVGFEDNLQASIARAEDKRDRLLRELMAFARTEGVVAHARLPEPFRPNPAPTLLDLEEEAIRTVIWATGFKRDFRWLDAAVLRPDGELMHEGGVLPVRGLYALGFRFLRRRNSNFIDGVGADAAYLADRIADQVGARILKAA